ncbi:PREDICTED: huntingtin-like isoform X2 [Amphimedon queenslandica]|uniref:Uncharacterized protein n=1 Tax=Amphimedon queenslandica TaxID=400682 RepID=A0AAN0J0T7_AMPQE|nr:PREDICTED: huntingtin-like isoform X2 [Amphimedon queenslandica]|eukprot:XP_019850343.1 PREDICTED: huntingtin-like isoform X2 [Amphimedon queenslandica]
MDSKEKGKGKDGAKGKDGGIKKESGGVKLLDTLKKQLIELSEPASSKTRSSRQVCQSLNDLTSNVINKLTGTQANFQLLPSTIELLVYAYANVDQNIRLAASDNLHKLLKSLMGSQLYRLQLGLYHELKKNGSARSICIVLECFSSLFSRTRPQKVHSLSQQLLPVLLRIIARPEEIIHENLIESLGKILPTMTPFLTSVQAQSFMNELLGHLQDSSASFRRMMSSTLVLLCIHSKVPQNRANWIISKLIALASTPTATQQMIQGVLLSLLNLLQESKTIEPTTSVLKQIYSLSLSAAKYGDHNTSNVAMEVVENVIRSSTQELFAFMTTPLTTPLIVQNIWSPDTFDSFSMEEKSDNESQLDAPCFDYFEDSEDGGDRSSTPPPGDNPPSSLPVFSSSTPLSHGRVSPSNTSLTTWFVSSTGSDGGYLTSSEGSNIPVEDLMNFISSTVLTHSRVSVQSVGLSVMTSVVMLYPSSLTGFNEKLESFLESEDPKLVSRMSQVLAQLIAAEIRENRGRFDQCRPIVNQACDKISAILSSESPVVLKAACESLRVCLLPLLGSTHPNKAIELLERLMKLVGVNYWLLKVELLQTLAIINYAELAIVKPLLLPKILEGVVIPLLSDADYRVRTAVSSTLVQLAKSLDHTHSRMLSLGRQHSHLSYDHLRIVSSQLSLAGIGKVEEKTSPIIPYCLEHIVWRCSVLLGSSSDHWGQRGALEALCVLADEYPPPTLPGMWGVNGSDCGLLEMVLQLLRGSWLSWQVATHHQLLQLSTSLFLACALDSLHQSASEGKVWDSGLERAGVVRHSTTLLLHVMKVLNIFQHVIDNKDPEEKEKKVIVKKIENLAKSPGDHNYSPPIKEAIGSFNTNPHYLKLYHALNSAYINYKVSIDPLDEDKFTMFLCQVHHCLAGVFEVALAEEVGRHVEEIIMYLTATIKVDSPGALLCLQQKLNALFGMNVATQQTHLYSPFLSSLPYSLEALPNPPITNSLVDCLVTFPLKQMNICLHAPPPTTPLTPAEEQPQEIKKRPKLWLFGAKRNLVLKPLNSLSSIKDYLTHFEPLIVSSLQLFTYTSSLLIQERVLFMMVQLLHLKVRYDLLDCNKSFFESVNHLVSLMETGSVKGGAQLVPHLFQFLVMLAHDQSKLITIPEVMQKCDSVMASGQNMISFAIPALQPLVLYLFVRPTTSKLIDLPTLREVVLNMLLRLVEYPRVIQLLIGVLECYQTNAQEWSTVSSLVFAALLAPLGRLQTRLDSPSSVSSLHQLLATMTPSAINAQGLMLALTKQTSITSLRGVTRWLAILSTILRLMSVVFPEETLLMQLKSIPLTTPIVSVFGSTLSKVEWGDESSDTVTKLARFLVESLTLGLCCLSGFICAPLESSTTDVLLPMILSDILLLMQILTKDGYFSLRQSLAKLTLPHQLLVALSNVSHCYPVLALHFTSLLVTCGSDEGIGDWLKCLFDVLQDPLMPSHQMLVNCLLSLLPSCGNWVKSLSPTVLLQLLESTEGMTLIKKASRELDTSLLSLLPPISSLTMCELMRVLSVIESSNGLLKGMDAIRLIGDQFIDHPMKIISDKSIQVLDGFLADVKLTASEASSIIDSYPSIKHKSVKTWKQLEIMSGHDAPEEIVEATVDPLTTGNVPNMVSTIDKNWQMKLITECLSSSSFSPSAISKLLIVLQRPMMEELVNHPQFSPSILEECIVHGIFQTLTKRNTYHQMLEYSSSSISVAPTVQSEELLVVCIECVMKYLKVILEEKDASSLSDRVKDSVPHLTRGLVWYLITQSQLSFDFKLTKEISTCIVDFAVKVLSMQCEELPYCHTISIESSLDLCSMALQTDELVSVLTDEWIQSVTGLLVRVIEHEYDAKFEISSGNESQTATHQLNWAVTYLSSFNKATELSHSIKTLTFTLARHSFFSPAIFLPPILTSMGGGDTITVQLLDQSLADSDILQEYMQRSNLIGWRTRNQFEELWMQLLGVLNAPLPDDEMPMEELAAHNISLCSGVRSATSLLVSTMLRPSPGSPLASVPMHTHRNKDFNFLSSPAGKKLLPQRALIESRILQVTALRSHRHSHYQLPLMSETQAISFPPVYSQNLERPLGYSSLTPCQLSYASLAPIILKTDVSSGKDTTPVNEIDTRSCIMSLVDLYTHLLSQPIDMLLLHHILTSIVMLSDMFVLSSQYEWMLQTFLKLLESHPAEDVLSESLLTFGAIKSAVVLRIDGTEAERVGKVIEQALGQDSFIITQNAALEGLLYVIEDNDSKIFSLVGPVVSKYIEAHLSSYKSYSEHHLLLVWALATHIVLHGQLTKDTSFTNHLLELVVPILSDSQVSCHFYQAVTLGLEYAVLSFSLTTSEKSLLRNLAATRFVQSDHFKSLSSLALLLTCMYTGEEADRLSGLSRPQDDMMALSDSVYQSREHISNILERLRQGNETEVEFLVSILPGLIVDFLPRMDGMNMVVSEVISQQQSRPWLAATVMSKTFELLLTKELDPALPDKRVPTVSDWVLLSLDSFIQQEPEVHALWSITCLLMAASISPTIRALFDAVAFQWASTDLDWLLHTLCTVAYSFYYQENFPQDQRKLFLDKFEKSNYNSLHKLAQNLRTVKY